MRCRSRGVIHDTRPLFVVQAALRSGALDVLVVDEALALGLLEKAEDSGLAGEHEAAGRHCPRCGFPLPEEHAEVR